MNFRFPISGFRLTRAQCVGALACAALLAACSPKTEKAAPASAAPAATNAVATLTPAPPPPMQSVQFGNRNPQPGEIVHGSYSRRTPVVEAVQKAMPSVVNIGTERLLQMVYSDPIMKMRAQLMDQFVRDFYGVEPPRRVQLTHALGSGVIIDEHGYILTNFHVLDRATRVRVMLDDQTGFDAQFIAGDHTDDLALIKIDVGTNRVLHPVEFADSDELFLGETVIAMGNPFGLSHTVTVGVLSATNREASYQGEVLYHDILQTDAAVNPGNSGGPLLNIEGKLIGINVAIFQEAQNIGFAQPIHRARQLLGRWLSPQHLKRGWLGFETAGEGGAVKVSYVPASGAAGAAGMKTDAIVSAVNGQPTADLFDFNRKLLGCDTGDTVNVTWSQGGNTKTTPFRILPLTKQDGNELAWRRLGLRLKPSVGTVVAATRFQKSLPVAEVKADSPASRIGLATGRYIWLINDVEIHNLDDVAAALGNVQHGDMVTLGLVDFNEDPERIVAHQSYVQVGAE